MNSSAAMRVRPDDPTYLEMARREAEFWARAPVTVAGLYARQGRSVARYSNQRLTGDPDLSWTADLVSRGPFETAAALGATQGSTELEWIRRRGSLETEVYDLSDPILRRTGERIAELPRDATGAGHGVRLVQADLNFVQLPEGKYDVVWTSACLHHLTNLEHLFQEIERSLRPGGLFAINDYVGERRLCYDPERIRLADAIYRQVPARYRTVGVERVQPPPEADKSPFEALRSDEILPLARERFDQLHLGLTGALHPLFFLLDTALMEREEAQWVERVLVAEEEAVRTPGIRACTAYAVFRKRR